MGVPKFILISMRNFHIIPNHYKYTFQEIRDKWEQIVAENPQDARKML